MTANNKKIVAKIRLLIKVKASFVVKVVASQKATRSEQIEEKTVNCGFVEIRVGFMQKV